MLTYLILQLTVLCDHPSAYPNSIMIMNTSSGFIPDIKDRYGAMASLWVNSVKYYKVA